MPSNFLNNLEPSKEWLNKIGFIHNYEIIDIYISATVLIFQKVVIFLKNLGLSKERLNKTDFIYFIKLFIYCKKQLRLNSLMERIMDLSKSCKFTKKSGVIENRAK